MNDSKNELEWRKIFEKHYILEKIANEGFAIITANEINFFREARLMTKFDHKSQLPKLFSSNNLCILPLTRGSYVIGKFEAYCSFEKKEVEITRINFPTLLESLDYRNINSEATAINCAYVSNILQDFTSENNLLPTVSGRMSSLSFEFNINSSGGNLPISVVNSQIEIDGGYEGDNSLNLIEAKNYISDDFLIRQLYYPYRLWNSKIQKKVRPIFLTYSNGIFDLREYQFETLNDYNSTKLIKHKKYSIQEGSFNMEMLQEILYDINVQIEPQNVPFPQADNFARIINLCELLLQRNFIPKEEITLNYDFDARQTDYYTNAGIYIGVLKKVDSYGKIGCVLTEKGKKILNVNLLDRQKEFTKLILSHKAFKSTLELYLEEGEAPPKERIVEIMKQSNLYKVSGESTFFRRSSTIIGWVNWIINQIEE